LTSQRTLGKLALRARPLQGWDRAHGLAVEGGMTVQRVRTETYFDGETLSREGPVLITIRDGTIESIGPVAPDCAAADLATPFLMPGLVEAHAHVFLDGTLLDRKERDAYLTAGSARMMATARANLEKCSRAGVTLVRDAGDRFGINHAVRDELRQRAHAAIELRSSGAGIRRANRYGGFVARAVDGRDEIAATVADICRSSDDVKVMLTGIIDFEKGEVNGAPQFDADELALIVAQAREHGRMTLAHCSGLAGLDVAVAAGVDSIEHGFFMTREILQKMADKSIAWVPTFSPVHVQWARPELAGWSQGTIRNLERILDAHREHVALAHRLGVALVAGSDAGSQGVDHGSGLIDELLHMLGAGVPMAALLTSATARPRRLWGLASTRVAAGQGADLILLDRSPFAFPPALREVRQVIKGETGLRIGDTG
jgi:imidazolonepropionase-like amidohydrolase